MQFTKTQNIRLRQDNIDLVINVSLTAKRISTRSIMSTSHNGFNYSEIILIRTDDVNNREFIQDFVDRFKEAYFINEKVRNRLEDLGFSEILPEEV